MKYEQTKLIAFLGVAINDAFATNETKIQGKKQQTLILQKSMEIPSNMPQFIIRASSSYFKLANLKSQVGDKLLKIGEKSVKKKQQRKSFCCSQMTKTNPQEPEQKYIQEKQIVKRKRHNSNQFHGLTESDIQSHSFIITKKEESLSKKEESRSSDDNSSFNMNDTINGKMCLICFCNPPDAVIMNCGHGGICYECAVDIWKKKNECYLCRNEINYLLQIDTDSKGESKKIVSLTTSVNQQSKDLEQQI